MERITFVRVSCAFLILVVSATLAVLGVLRHPSKFPDAESLEDLEEKVRCAQCFERREFNTAICEKCERSNFDRIKYQQCQLTSFKREKVSKLIEARVQQEQWKKETVEKASRKDTKSLQRLKYLAKNVPRPTAHWTLDRSLRHGEVVLNDWIYATGSEYSHTENGIEHLKDGGMGVSPRGWYQIYIQASFVTTNASQEEKRKFEVTLESTGETDEETAGVLQMNRIATCHSEHGTCMVLRKQKLIHLAGKETLRVRVNVPQSTHLAAGQRETYFGIFFVRGSSDGDNDI